MGNFTLSFGSCTYIYNNTAQGSCANDNLDLSIAASGKTLTLTYLNATNPASPLLSQASAQGCTCVYWGLTVTSTIPISKALANIAGTDLYNTLNNEVKFPSIAGTPYVAATISNSNATSVSSTYYLSSLSSSLNLNMQIGVNGYNPGTLSLNSASVVFTQVPEPGSVLTVLTGIAGLGAVRRFRRRPREPSASRETCTGRMRA